MNKPTLTALITGASSGIGAALARVLAERGYNLVLTARRQDRLEALAEEIQTARKNQVRVIPHDLGAIGGGAALAARVDELGIPIDFLCNNAGFGLYGPAHTHDLVRVREMLELNLVSLTELTQRYAARMVERGGGRILQVASIGAFQPSPLYAVYAATKAYVLSYSEAIHHELRRSGVTVTTVCPGMTDTEFHQVAAHLKPKSMELFTMSSRKVAEIAVRTALRGKPVVTPGWYNKLAGFFVRFLPRSWVVAIAGKTMEGKREGT
jgi:short-subunit dehydrogenase